jgi:hypothetical protein
MNLEKDLKQILRHWAECGHSLAKQLACALPPPTRPGSTMACGRLVRPEATLGRPTRPWPCAARARAAPVRRARARHPRPASSTRRKTDECVSTESFYELPRVRPARCGAPGRTKQRGGRREAGLTVDDGGAVTAVDENDGSCSG